MDFPHHQVTDRLEDSLTEMNLYNLEAFMLVPPPSPTAPTFIIPKLQFDCFLADYLKRAALVKLKLLRTLLVSQEGHLKHHSSREETESHKNEFQG